MQSPVIREGAVTVLEIRASEARRAIANQSRIRSPAPPEPDKLSKALPNWRPA